MYSDDLIKKYLINAFALEFDIDFYKAKDIIIAMELFEVLIERYWDEIYGKIKGEK